MAHKKAGGSSKNGRDSNPNFLGVKRFDTAVPWPLSDDPCTSKIISWLFPLSGSKIETQSSRDDERLNPCPEIAESEWFFAYW